MKNILIIVFLLIGISSNGQVFQKSTSYGNEFIRLMGDSTFHPPFRSKNTLNMSNANRPSIITATEDSCLWISMGFGLPYNIKVLNSRDTSIINDMLSGYGYGDNFSNADLTLNGDRVHRFDNNSMSWKEVISFEIKDSLLNRWFSLDTREKTIMLGDIDGSLNSTTIAIDDSSGIDIEAFGRIRLNAENGTSVSTVSDASPNTDSTFAYENGTGVFVKYHQPYSFKTIFGTTSSGSTETELILTTLNRTAYRIEVSYVGRNAFIEVISGKKAATYYGGTTALLVGSITDLIPENLLNLDASAYCDIVISGADLNVEFHSDASDGDLEWEITIEINEF